jgi:hypothetical protein
MSAFLDYLVSTSWLAITVYIFLLFAITGIWFLRPFRSMILNRILHAGFSLGAFAFLMYMHLGPSGYAVQFTYGLSNGEQLCLVEKHWQSDGDAGSSEVWRLYVLDLETGKRIYRMSLESPEILYVSDSGVVFFLWNYAVEYNLLDGTQTREWSKEKGFEKFPQLKSGIQDLNRQSEYYRNVNSGYLTLTAMDGHYYCYDFATDQLIPTQYIQQADTTLWHYDEYGIYRYDFNRNEERSYRFETKTGEIEQLTYNQRGGIPVTFNGEFLDPSIVAMNVEKKYFIVKHFTTLDHTNAILSAIHFDLSPKWSVEQASLGVADQYDEKPEIGQCIYVNDNLVVTYGGFVVYLNGDTGEVIWKKRE